MDESKGISRRSFLAGAGLAGAAALSGAALSGFAAGDSASSASGSGAASGSASGSTVASGSAASSSAASGSGAASGAAASGSNAAERTWDKETDVLVIGYGGAGANVAITAFDAGSEVLIIEKMENGGGNTTLSLGGWICPTSADDTYTYICKLFEVSHQVMDDEVVRMFSDEVVKNNDWIMSLDDSAEIEVYGGSGFPDLEGADSQQKCRLVPHGGERTGDALYETYTTAIEDRDIEVMCNTPATELITDETGAVIGCLATSDGKDIAIKARKAVVLTCGSFEYDEDLKMDNIKGWPLFALGNPGNSGDGIRMGQKVGAAMWHMGVCAAQLGYKDEGCESAYKLGFKSPNYFWVNGSSQRFANEPSVEAHSILNIMDIYDADPSVLAYPNNPIYLIFDETARLNGAICSSYAWSRNVHVWSDDNSEEIDAGWIKKADTFEDLATQLGLDPDTLAATAERFNSAVDAGTDEDFGRAITKTASDGTETVVSATLSTPPFYGIQLGCALFHCGGGPRRNAKGQIIDPFGNPIPHLYSAGEIGTMWGPIYQGAGMNAEAMVTGRIAGANAAAETAWE